MPLTRARCARAANRVPKIWACSSDRPRPDDRRPGKRPGTAAIRAQHDVRIQHLHEGAQVPGSRSGEERVDDAPLNRQVRVGLRSIAADAPACTARELSGGLRRSAEDAGDLVERHREDVVQDEGEPLGRRQRFEHDEKRKTDGIREHDIAFRVVVGGETHDRLR